MATAQAVVLKRGRLCPCPLWRRHSRGDFWPLRGVFFFFFFSSSSTSASSATSAWTVRLAVGRPVPLRCGVDSPGCLRSCTQCSCSCARFSASPSFFFFYWIEIFRFEIVLLNVCGWIKFVETQCGVIYPRGRPGGDQRGFLLYIAELFCSRGDVGA